MNADLRLVHFEATHDADAGAPIFVDVEAIDFDIGRNTKCELLEGWMDA